MSPLLVNKPSSQRMRANNGQAEGASIIDSHSLTRRFINQQWTNGTVLYFYSITPALKLVKSPFFCHFRTQMSYFNCRNIENITLNQNI